MDPLRAAAALLVISALAACGGPRAPATVIVREPAPSPAASLAAAAHAPPPRRPAPVEARAELRFDPETGAYTDPDAGVTFEPSTTGVAHPWYKVDYLCRDRAGAVLAHVLHFDNGLDDLAEGLRRYADHGKVGFVDARCRVVIPAAWDFAFPFEAGRARVCDGCTQRPEGEHFRVVGGREAVIDRAGNVR